MSRPASILAVTSLALEACIARGAGTSVLCSQALELNAALLTAIKRGASGIISFGFAGGLAPDLVAGSWVVASSVRNDKEPIATDRAWAQSLLEALPNAIHAEIVGADAIVMNPLEKSRLHAQTGAVAVDMESHIVAKIAFAHDIPFAACRIVIDAACRTLPPAVTVGLRPDRTADAFSVLRSVLKKPNQLPDLMRTALDAFIAWQALRLGRKQLGADLGFPY